MPQILHQQGFDDHMPSIAVLNRLTEMSRKDSEQVGMAKKIEKISYV